MIHHIVSVLSPDQVTEIVDWVESAQLTDGRVSNPDSTVKKNQQVPQEDLDPEIAAIVTDALFTSPAFCQITFPKVIANPTFARYETGMAYGPHLDEPLFNAEPVAIRSDLSCTVFLSSPDEYEGGELELWLGHHRAALKAKAGDAVVYPTGAIHQVRKVTSGIRLVAVTWVQSYIADMQERNVLAQYYQLMARVGSTDDETTRLLLESVRTNLFRMWADG